MVFVLALIKIFSFVEVEEEEEDMFPLVVVDVYIHLPAPGSAPVTTTGGGGGRAARISAPPNTLVTAKTSGRGGGGSIGDDSGDSGNESSATGNSSRGTGSGASRQLQKKPTGPVMGDTINPGGGLFLVDLHQVVGAFSCSSDKLAPNLDCGLIEWSHFFEMHQFRKPDEGREFCTAGGPSRKKSAIQLPPGGAGVARSNQSSANTPTSRGFWTNPNPLTGIKNNYRFLRSVSLWRFTLIVVVSCCLYCRGYDVSLTNAIWPGISVSPTWFKPF